MNNEFQPLKGKIALITGGSRGIGAGITRKLAAWGCTVCINFVDRAGPAGKLKQELSEQGIKASLHQADISQPDEIEALLQGIQALHGGLDILIQNAAATKFTLLEDAALPDWQFVQDTNARSTWLLAKHAIPLMRDRPGARFITITNSTTTSIVPRGGLFAVAKGGLEVMTEYLSYELAPYGIVANCVRPGLVRTDVLKVRPDFDRAALHELAISPWRGERMTTVDNSADVVAMLCQEEASWIVGQTITVDGGFSLWGGIPPRVDAARQEALGIPASESVSTENIAHV
jgi:NAD(P)-dependent dehydrogenase (short-subunit alcohol dehydrogenase family)